MSTKQYKTGLFIGRFQPLTIGHCSIINDALTKVDRLIVAIGSTQESETTKNPYSATLRLLMLTKVYEKAIKQGKIILALIPDRNHPKDDEARGQYLIENVSRQTGIIPDVIFEGSENARNLWFNEKTKREIIDKKLIPINASTIRECILMDDYETFEKFMPVELNDKKFYYELKSILEKVTKNER